MCISHLKFWLFFVWIYLGTYVNITMVLDTEKQNTLWVIFRFKGKINKYGSTYLPSLKLVLNVIKKRLLHHVRDLVPF